METFDALWEFPICKKLESKLIFLVFQLFLGNVLLFNLEQKKPHLVWGAELIPFLKFLNI